MENPATWKRAELIIWDARANWLAANEAGAVGASFAHHVAAKLREAGLLNDQAEPEIGWAALRERRASR